ncbi:iron ABC transporter permease [Pradoshia sp. D12]|uniref:FecCD family ABC transporter permease n=1 Tax=Bacillaceae TaxID=186817 RepID=UPI00080AE0C5|nr:MULTISPECIES: iron ABC transporter permease [Bacillaceae]OCA81150.1 iron ABC transporter permease [Bacillus sp. FJAT-27986]QFK73082.1 iron ABC transporter permease [Pradoshia sp. D12]TPF72074.1 iron ABC transporter permease [Bacillus sp. D12]
MKKIANLPRVWIALFILIITVSLISLNIGKVSISPAEVWQTIVGNGTAKQELVLFEIRLPAILLAILVGAGMAISGAVLQTVAQNELAEPGILGINAGAGLAVLIYITVFQSTLGSQSQIGTFIMPFFAFAGAMLTAVLILALSWKKGLHTIRLLLVGIGINAGFSAVLTAMQLRLNPHDFMKAIVWLSGDLWATQWKYVWALLPWFLILIPFILYKSHTLNVLNLGSLVSSGLGIRTEKERLVLIGAAVALAGLGVTVGGGIAFLGLIAPHIARKLVGPKHGAFLPASAMIGALILLLADMLGKNMFRVDIPSGVIVSIISAPYFIYLLMKSK